MDDKMIEIKFDENKKQSIAYDKNIKIGECDFIENESCWNIIHTEVSNLYQGQGIARRLVENILENAKKQNKKVIAECSYAKKVIKMSYNIREIEEKDNKKIEDVIRKCLIEFGANHEGTAWTDPNLGRFSEIYNTDGNKYWVAENKDGEIVGGVGIGKLEGIEDVCELQKMYCLPEARGTGVAHELIQIALEYAQKYYNRCYLETLDNMIAAQKFYEKYGFERVKEPVVKTEHFACDVRYIKNLK